MEYNLTLITSNKDKIRQAKEVFSNTSIQINYIANDLPEIQANSSIEIAKETAIYYAKKINGAVIREDHSLFINALYPFPGPYTNYFDKNMPVETLLSILKNEKDRTGYFELAAILATPDGTVREYSYKVNIEISNNIIGNQGNWDKVLMLEGEDKTFSQKVNEGIIEVNNVWNKNYKNILHDILDKETSK